MSRDLASIPFQFVETEVLRYNMRIWRNMNEYNRNHSACLVLFQSILIRTVVSCATTVVTAIKLVLPRPRLSQKMLEPRNFARERSCPLSSRNHDFQFSSLQFWVWVPISSIRLENDKRCQQGRKGDSRRAKRERRHRFFV